MNQQRIWTKKLIPHVLRAVDWPDLLRFRRAPAQIRYRRLRKHWVELRSNAARLVESDCDDVIDPASAPVAALKIQRRVSRDFAGSADLRAMGAKQVAVAGDGALRQRRFKRRPLKPSAPCGFPANASRSAAPVLRRAADRTANGEPTALRCENGG